MPASASDTAKSKESCYGSVSPQTHYFLATEVISPSRRWASQGRVKLFSKFCFCYFRFLPPWLPRLAADAASNFFSPSILRASATLLLSSLRFFSPDIFCFTTSKKGLESALQSQHKELEVAHHRWVSHRASKESPQERGSRLH
jgi:hypothetical protein